MVRLGTARAPIVLLATLLVAGLAGCAQPITSVDRADPMPGAGAGDSIGDYPGGAGADCESDGMTVVTPRPLTPLPADAVLVSARRCLYQAEVVPGDGEWLMRVEQRASSGLDALAAALRLPSEEKSSATACLAIGYVPIVITVSDTAGRAIQPEVPQSACGAPLKAAVDAIAALPWTTVATTKARQIRSELEVSSGCAGAYKPVIPLTAAEGSGTQTQKVDATARSLRVCRFDLDPDPANVITLSNGTPFRMGVLKSVSTLDSNAGGLLLTALASAPRAVGTCAHPEQPFAVIDPTDGSGPNVMIELGGCYRASLDGENYVRQLDAATVAPLLG